MDKARDMAFRAVREVQAKGAYANVVLAQMLSRETLSEQDRRFLTGLVYGTVKAEGTLDWILRRYSSRPIKKISASSRALLHLGLYQIFYMKKVPASAACNTAVELAKRYERQASGFINAVLRSAVREPEKAAFPAGKGHAIDELALKSFHPRWLVKKWVKELGFEGAERLCAFDNESAPVVLRANTLLNTREELLAELESLGAGAMPSRFAPEGVVLGSHGALCDLAPLAEGRAQVQDESSMLVAHVLAPRPGDLVLDCCSAPGGKTTHIAALMENKGRVIAGDIYEHKLKRIEENAARLKIDIIETVLLDAREAGEEYEEMCDRVLVDAPCSGLGVLRRKADARWKKSEAEVEALPALQLEILRSAARAVKKGGVLVYSTCTIERAENAAVVEAFLKENAEFTLEQTGSFLPEGAGHAGDMMVQLYPHVDGTDGFFIARMRRA